jgi:hypothetical protein
MEYRDKSFKDATVIFNLAALTSPERASRDIVEE